MVLKELPFLLMVAKRGWIMPEIARNPRTGEVLILSQDGQWEPAERARNPNTGQELFFDGERWVDVSTLRPQRDTKFDRFLTGLGDYWYGGLQLLANTLPRGVASAVPGLTPEQTRERVAQREAAFRDARVRQGLSPNGFDPYRLAGEITATLPLMAVPGAQTLLGAALQGAAIGAGLGAIRPIDAEGDEYHRRLMDNLRFGAMAGGFGGAASNLVGRALAPRIDPKVQRLHEAGVELTPGQVIGGTARKIEDQLASYPLGIDAARRRGIESFNRAVADEVLAPLGKRAPRDVPVGRELLQRVEQAVDSAYDDALSRIPPLRPDTAFKNELQAALAQRFQTSDALERFRNAIQRDVGERLAARQKLGTIDGETIQSIMSNLKDLSRRYQGNPDDALRELAPAFNAVREVFSGLVERQAPAAAPRLQAANAAYARFVRMQTAAGMQGATDGVFSPAHFSYAVRQADPSLRHSAYARGNALMQDLSDAARAVLPQTVPDSGTAGRALAGLIVSGGASGWLNSPTPLAAFLASQALYSRPINQAIVNTMLATRPPAIVATGEAVRRMGAPVAVPLGNMLLEPPPPETLR
jgi:hypothetical protein